MLAQSRALVAASRQAMAASRDSINASASRTHSSEVRRRRCMAAPGFGDVDAAKFLQNLRSALDQALIDREVSLTGEAFRDHDGDAPPQMWMDD